MQFSEVVGLAKVWDERQHDVHGGGMWDEIVYWWNGG